MNRRAFVAATAGVLGAAVWLVWDNRVGLLRVLTHVSLEDRIREALPGLDLDPDGLRRFVEAYEAQHGAVRRGGWVEPDIALTYLASTDYFGRPAGVAHPVRFVAYYDPYVSPCWNPCATRWSASAAETAASAAGTAASAAGTAASAAGTVPPR